jgi:hypothetical protein
VFLQERLEVISLQNLAANLTASNLGSQTSTNHKAPSILSSPSARLSLASDAISTGSSPSDLTPSILNLQPEHPKSVRLLIEMWFLSAGTFRRCGKVSDAIGAITEAEEISKGDREMEAEVEFQVGAVFVEYYTTLIIFQNSGQNFTKLLENTRLQSLT